MHTSLDIYMGAPSFFGLPGQPAPTPYYIAPLNTRAAPPLPELPAASIDRSTLTVGDGSVLVYYISNDVDFATATRAIITVHGVKRDAHKSFTSMRGAVEAANKNDVVIMAVSPLDYFIK